MFSQKKFISFIAIAVITSVISACGSEKNDELEPVDIRYERGMEYFQKKKYEKSITELKFVTFNAPASEMGDDAQFYMAEAHFELKEYILAISEYERLVRIHPESPLVEEGAYKRALCFDILSPKSHHDQENTLKALDAYQEYIEDWPQSDNKEKAEARLDKLRFKLAKKKYDAGIQYRKLDECKASIIYLQQLLDQYYDSEFAPGSRWNIARCEMKLENWSEALAMLIEIINRNDDSEYVQKAQKVLPEVREKAEKSEEQALVEEN